MTNHRFQVVYDADYAEYIVRVASHAFAQSEVIVDHQTDFPTKAQALEQVRRLTVHQRKGNDIRTQNRFTPGCFEAVADTKYGCEW